MFHPNVFPSGTVDLNFLTQPEAHWKSSITIMEVSADVLSSYTAWGMLQCGPPKILVGWAAMHLAPPIIGVHVLRKISKIGDRF